jgi:phosphatidylglycerol---prolipoprotein diacylglyceryl transferase
MCLVSYVYWNVSPVLFHLGPLVIRWYGLFFAIVFALGFLIMRWQFRVEHKDASSLDKLALYIMAGTIVGARLGHCLFYDPVYYFRHPVEILMVWRGGLASHGGAAGILIALYLYTRNRPDQPYLWLLDRMVVPAALGGSLIRLGNLFNSEILGTPTRVPWAFVFEQVSSQPRHPVQLYESIAYALIFVMLLRVYRRLRAQTPSGLLLGLFLVSVFMFRFFIEFLKQPQAAYAHHLPLKTGQWLSIPFIGLGAVLLWRVSRRRR